LTFQSALRINIDIETK